MAEDHVTLALQPVKAVRVEQNFAGHFPIAEILLRRRLSDEMTFSFEGIGFVVQGSARSESAKDQEIVADMYVDDRRVETIGFPPTSRAGDSRRSGDTDSRGKHTVRLKIRNPSADASVSLERAVIYGSKPGRPVV